MVIDKTRETFIRQERDVFNAFAAPVLSRDYALVGRGWVNTTVHSREYRCACGFRTADAGAIYDHAQACAKVLSRAVTYGPER